MDKIRLKRKSIWLYLLALAVILSMLLVLRIIMSRSVRPEVPVPFQGVPEDDPVYLELMELESLLILAEDSVDEKNAIDGLKELAENNVEEIAFGVSVADESGEGGDGNISAAIRFYRTDIVTGQIIWQYTIQFYPLNIENVLSLLYE